MSFSDIKGQDIAVHYLKNILTKERVPPTLLFLGKKGVGRFLTAITFAKALNCKNAYSDSCDKCESCIAIRNNIYPNVKIVGRNTERVGIDDVRSIIISSFVPLKGGFKVNIIDNADKSTIQAFNSMLKYLEEPPKHTINILIAYEESTIPETIRSRAVRVVFRPLSYKLILEILIDKGMDNEQANLIAHIAGGSIDGINDTYTDNFIKLRKNFILAVLHFLKNEEGAVTLLSKWKGLYPTLSPTENAGKFFDTFSTVVRDILLISILREKENIVNIDFLGHIAENFSIIRERTLEKIFDVINSEKKALLTNANPQYIMMDGIFRIKEVVK